MNDLEHRINQYLDGELSPTELDEFRELLDSSEETRRLLGSMQLIRSAARSFPTLSIPDPALESALFQELFAEEDWASVQVEEEEGRRRAGVIPLFRSGIEGIAAFGPGRAALVLPALLLLILVGERFISSDSPADTTEAIASVTPQENVPAVEAPPGVAASTSTSSLVENLSPVGSEPGLRNFSASEIRNDQPQDMPIEENGIGGIEQKDNDVVAPHEEPPSDISPSIPYADNSSSRNNAPDNAPEENPRFDEWDFDRPESDNSHGTSFLSASYRHGVATFFGERESILASGQDLNLRIDGQVAERHRLSVVVGSSPVLVAERTYTIHTSVSPDEKGPGTPTTASVTSEESNRVDGEVWAGVGYGYTVFEGNGFRVEAGVNAGLGEQSARYGLEIPTRINVTDRIGVELVPYITRILPRDQEIRDSEVTPERFDQFGEEWTPNSTSIGAQIGLSFSFGG